MLSKEIRIYEFIETLVVIDESAVGTLKGAETSGAGRKVQKAFRKRRAMQMMDAILSLFVFRRADCGIKINVIDG